MKNRRAFLKSGALGLFLPLAPKIVKAQAFSFRDLPFLQPKSGSGISPITNDWANRVVSNGGAMPSQATIIAVNTWYNGLVTDGLDSTIFSCSFFAPDNAIAARTPFFKLFGSDPYPIEGAPIFSGVQGYLVAGAGTSGIITGVNPNNVCTGTSIGLTLYTGGASGNLPNGQFGGGGGGRYVMVYSTSFSAYTAFQLGSITNPFSANTYGYFSYNRTGANQLDVYAANGTVAFANIKSSGALAAGAIPTGGNIGCYCQGATTGWPYAFSSSQKITVLCIHSGWTSAQAQAFFNRCQTLRIAFGGGYT